MSESNVQLARRGFEAVMRGDVTAIGEILDPDVKWHGGDPSFEGACHNRDDVLTFMGQAVRRQPLAELVDVIGAGDMVVVIIQPGSPGAQRPAPVANLTTFRDGKVVEMVHYDDPAEALAAAGVPEGSARP